MPPTVAVPEVGAQQPAQHADGGGLAGAVAAEEPEDLAAADVERQLVHGHERAKAPGQPPDLDGIGAGRLTDHGRPPAGSGLPSDRAVQPRLRQTRTRRRRACDPVAPGAPPYRRRAPRCSWPRRRRSARPRRAALRQRRAMPSSATAMAARLASSSRRRPSTSKASCRSKSDAAGGQRAGERGRFRLLRAAASAVPQRPADVHRHVPRVVPRVEAREDARVGTGVVVARGQRDLRPAGGSRGRGAGAAGRRPRFEGPALRPFRAGHVEEGIGRRRVRRRCRRQRVGRRDRLDPHAPVLADHAAQIRLGHAAEGTRLDRQQALARPLGAG